MTANPTGSRLGISLAAILSLGLPGCAAPTDPGSDGPLVRTAKTEYTVRATDGYLEAAVVATFTNRTGRPVYFDWCPARLATLERADAAEGAWIPAYDPIAVCVGTNGSRRLAVGAARTDTLNIWACRPGRNCVPEFDLPPEGGDYRLVYSVSSHPDLQDPLPFTERVSNTFRLEPE